LVCTLDAAGTVVDYYQSDNLHSSSILTSGTGGTTQHYEYTAYGQDRYINSATAFPVTRRFTSQAKDDETGLMYYGARYYDPELGRFIQADTEIGNVFNPQNLNRYSYAANNPQKYIDPTGHWEWYPWTYNWMPNGMANWLNSGASAPRPAPSANPAANLAMLKSELGGYDASDLHAAARVGETVANLNPVVGTFNSAYTAGTGNNSINPNQKVSKGERIEATGQTFAAMLPIVGKLGSSANAADHIVLGIRAEGLENTAAQIGARHLLNDPNWRATLQTAIGNPNARFTIAMDGFSGSSTYSQLMGAAQRGVTPTAKATEWEVGQLYQAGRLQNATLMQGGKVIPNPLAE
jgi:RHS repeat-associated protein